MVLLRLWKAGSTSITTSTSGRTVVVVIIVKIAALVRFFKGLLVVALGMLSEMFKGGIAVSVVVARSINIIMPQSTDNATCNKITNMGKNFKGVLIILVPYALNSDRVMDNMDDMYKLGGALMLAEPAAPAPAVVVVIGYYLP